MSITITTPAGYEFDKKDYYESRNIGKGRSEKSCVFCGKSIPKGQRHTMHHFYPEFYAYATHDMNPNHGDKIEPGEESCTEKFTKLFE